MAIRGRVRMTTDGSTQVGPALPVGPDSPVGPAGWDRLRRLDTLGIASARFCRGNGSFPGRSRAVPLATPVPPSKAVLLSAGHRKDPTICEVSPDQFGDSASRRRLGAAGEVGRANREDQSPLLEERPIRIEQGA